MLTIEIKRQAGKITSAKVIEKPYVDGVAYSLDMENRNDWKTFAAAQEVAAALGEGYIATDAGAHVSPRYDVVTLPKVGDEVSYAFNGDSYPCGKIMKISDSKFRIAVLDGQRTLFFYRRRLTGSWVMDGTWFLVAGHVSKRNPEF